MHTKAVTSATILVLLIVVIVTYERCKLNRMLPATLQKKNCGSTSGFVGALARTPEMQHCMAYSSPYAREPYFNRCNYV
jgi:hypothetical protein